jgi:hypothetical protein
VNRPAILNARSGTKSSYRLAPTVKRFAAFECGSTNIDRKSPSPAIQLRFSNCSFSLLDWVKTGSSVSGGRAHNSSTRLWICWAVSLYVRSFSSSLPLAAAGSGILHCETLGSPGKTGQESSRRSQTVMMISNFVSRNSSHDLLRACRASIL